MQDNVISIIASIVGSVASGFTIYLFKQFNKLQIEVARLESTVEAIKEQTNKTKEALDDVKHDISEIKILIERLVTTLEYKK